MPQQRCPACGVLHDVGIFVSGQQVRCSACGLPFTVRRDDSMVFEPAVQQPDKQKAAEVIPKVPPPSGKREAPSGGRDLATITGADGLGIPGYQMYEMLGKGGMGRVYRALQVSLDRVVAIKILNEDLAKHKSFIRRFEKESGALAALNHPHITAVIDRGHVGDTYYFVMEYVGGPSLRQKLNRTRASLDEIIDITLALCRAVDHAHQRGVIHRDLKPENVLFSPEGVLKVADFGLANIVGPDKRWELTRTKVSMGTVNYMAPEQRRDAKHVDHRADIYSLGVILYECLVRELPIGRFDPPSHRRKDVDQRLDRLVLKMLDYEPDRRPQRAGLVAASLESMFGARASARRQRDAAKAEQEVLEKSAAPSSGEKREAEAVSTQVSESPQEPAPKPPRGRRRMRSFLLLLLGGVLFLAVAAGIAVLLLYQNLESAPGDLVLKQGDDGFHLNVMHPREEKYLKPAQAGRQGGRRMVRFDFLPSTLPVVPVRLQGGSWDAVRGELLQDTCRSAFTINQVPARALFGQKPLALSGALEIQASMQARRATHAIGDRVVSLEEFMRKTLGAKGALLPVSPRYRAGLGFMDRDGTGLEILLPVGPGEDPPEGVIQRLGEEMEGTTETFPLPADFFASDLAQTLKLLLSEGRVRFEVGGRELVDAWAGFPLEFKGYPSVACQNARCSVRSLEYSWP